MLNYKKWCYLKQVAYFSKIYHPTSYQVLKVSGASVTAASRVRAFSSLLLPIVDGWKVRRWGILQGHNVHGMFRE
jgi:hypothetical protein